MREKNPGDMIRVEPDGVTWTKSQHAACIWAASRFKQALPMLDTMSFEDLYQAAAVRVLMCENGHLGAAAFSGVKDAVRQEWGKDSVRLRMKPLVEDLVSRPEPLCSWNEEALALLAEDENALDDLRAEGDEELEDEELKRPKRRKRTTRTQKCAYFKREQWERIMGQLAEARET